MHSFFILAFFATLAGRVLALNIAIGGAVGNVNASQFLAIPDPQITADCLTSCTPANTAILNCGDTNDTCLCSSDTVTAITACEQCMFADIINKNVKMPDPRAGSTPALAAYAAACLASVNVTIPPASIALALPQNWDGPAGLGLNMPATVVTVAVGAFLGGSAMFLLSTM
ncbi:hypothetical protein JAAARDRAFT_38152 [Jaapia argillacea MUCL 33604]|uniref:Extracellular membrane protein CFEM domain-containing protein n=1 Tax=Jaapia argillacea MUCL 33604 TaxID=933084 RepID=A0A067PHW5_9AGAM|nr:hypothetical protein JAAARDRAFT_38152 [Jaapia argillacea MUCL 33604]